MIDNEATVIYPSMIKDDKISLVNEEMYRKATRNHFENKEKALNITKQREEGEQIMNNTNESKFNSNRHIKNGVIGLNSNLDNINTLPNNTNSAIKLPLLGSVANKSLPDSPKFNNSSSIREEDDGGGDLNVTFKNSKKNSEKLKLYEELYLQIDQLSKDNEVLRNKNYDLEEKLLEKSNENKKLTNSLDHANEEFGKITAKHNALLIYASDIQKKLDFIEIELNEKNRELEKYTSLDWGKLLTEKETIIRVLQNDLNVYKSEFNNIKTNLLSNQKGYVNDISKRIDSLLDTYLNDNKKYKKILEEYKMRENECSRKWNELLKENNTNIEKVNLLHTQLSDQIEHFNNIIADYDKRVAETLTRIPRMMEQFDTKKSEAAQYLVDQTNLIMEEKRKLIEENNTMENKIEILIFDNEKLKLEIKNFYMYFENNQNIGNSFNSNMNGSGNFNVKGLKMKIEELEDILTQYKNTNSPNKIIEIEENILSLTQRLSEKDKLIENLNNKLKDYLKKTNILFDERQAITSLSNVMKEKDIAILNLRNQLKDLSEMHKVKNNEIDNLSRILEKREDNNNQNFLSKEYEEMLTSKDKLYNPNLYIEKVESIDDVLMNRIDLK